MSNDRVLATGFERQVAEHGGFKCLPGGVGVGDAAYGALGDTGMGGTEAFESGAPAELAPLFQAAAQVVAEQVAGAGDPGALEGVHDHASWVAENGVVEGEGFLTHLIGAGWPVLDEFHANGAHALVGEMPVGLQDIGRIRQIPLEKREMDGDVVIEVDTRGGTGAAVKHWQGFGNDFGEGGEGRGLRIGD